MKITLPILAVAPLLLSLLCTPVLAAGDAATMNDEERAEMLRLLDESRELLLGLIGSVTEEQWSWKSAPDRWSVGECAEHIIRSEQALFDSVQGALATPADPEWAKKTKGKADLLRQVMPNRRPQGQGGATAPQEIRPQGTFTRDQMIAEFNKIRTEVRNFSETTDQPLKEHIETHPFPIFGDLNAHDWLIYVPLHTIRHSRQIIEVQETDGYPGS